MMALGVMQTWTQEVSAAPDVAATAQCSALASAEFSNIQDAPTQVTEAKLIAASGSVPALCQVQGYVTPNVGFSLQLPASNWNGKFFERGCGGSCGRTESMGCNGTVQKGYACLISDMGHRGIGLDGLWASNNLQAQVDFGYRGAHVVALAGKAIAERYYGRAPKHSYFLGCSTGGRQALVEAQRFPWDFDGIIAGGLWIDDTASTMDELWAVRALKYKDGKAILSHANLQLVHDAALAKCDLDDGIRDGIIGNPLACKFDPADLVCRAGQQSECLTKVQADAVKKVYAGPMNSKGDKFFVGGAMPGSELAWEGLLLSTAPPAFGLPGSKSVVEIWATEYFRYMIMPPLGPDWKLTDFDFDRDYKRLGATSESLLNAGNPDLRKFKAAGGKLIAYQGWNDPLGAIPEKTVDYYETVEKTLGGRAETQEFFRLFMVPGMDHCTGGDGAFAIDYLGYLEGWVERGEAPDRLIGAHIDGVSDARPYVTFPLNPAQHVKFTRPVFPYPIQAKYRGAGDPNRAENFVPVEAKSGR